MRTIVLLLLLTLATVPAHATDWSAGVSYVYDGVGNIRKIGTDAYVYDAVGRLVQADTEGVRRTYSYDQFGNRQSCSQLPEATNCQYSWAIGAAKNQIAGAGVQYDGSGNLTAFDGHQYTYDAFNMQTRDVQSPLLISEYIYTADDERIAVYAPVTGGWRWSLRDASGKVLRDVTSRNPSSGALGSVAWNWEKDYVYRDGQLLASVQIEPGATVASKYFYHLDHLGTPRLITEAAGRTVGKHSYHAFGPELPASAQSEPSATRLKYTGHERDGNLDYMHARYYHPMMGRFLSVDPKERYKATGSPQEWNRYAYALNNPLKYIDPDGRDAEIAAGSNVRAVKAYLTELASRPTGRAQLLAVVNDPGFKLRITTGALTPAALLGRSAQQRSAVTATFGQVVPTGNVHQPAPGAPGQFIVTGGTMTFDPTAISRAHPDKTGTSTAAHEFHHANALQTGGVAAAQAGDQPTSASGPANQHGQQVAAEKPDMSKKDARKLIDQLVPVRP